MSKLMFISVVTKGGVTLCGFDTEEYASALQRILARYETDSRGTFYLKARNHAEDTEELTIVLWSEVAAIMVKPANKHQVEHVTGVLPES